MAIRSAAVPPSRCCCKRQTLSILLTRLFGEHVRTWKEEFSPKLAEEINQLHHANVFIKTCMHCTGLPAVWYRHCTASGGDIRVYRRVRWAPPRVGVLPYTPHHLFLLRFSFSNSFRIKSTIFNFYTHGYRLMHALMTSHMAGRCTYGPCICMHAPLHPSSDQ
jgi:hypothetical protein